MGNGRVYVVAEAGANCNGSLDTAKRLIDAAVDAGADAIKWQTFRAEQTCLPNHPFFADYKAAEMPREWLPELKAHAGAVGIDMGSTPDDLEAVQLLADLDCPFMKIASCNLTYRRLIEAAARTGKRLFISTGRGTLDECSRAAIWAYDAGASDVTLLQCAVYYPAEARQMNLRAIQALAQVLSFWAGLGFVAHRFRQPSVGLSDHTLSTTLPAVAVGMGATVVEKHFTLARNQDGPDHGHSLEPGEFRCMVEAIREAEEALGDSKKGPLPEELPKITRSRRGLYWVRDLPAGHIITGEDVCELMPQSSGLNAEHVERALGMETKHRVSRLQPVQMDALRVSWIDQAAVL